MTDPPPMNPDQFWTSQDGQILTVKNKDERTVTLTLGFWPRHPVEFDFMKASLAALKFTLRSSMARVGIEMITQGQAHVEGNRLELETDAFIYDASFPNASYWKKLMRVGSPVGRVFYAPVAAKLSTGEIWDALKENRIKLPHTISIDSLGRVFLTPAPAQLHPQPAAGPRRFRARAERSGGSRLSRSGANPP